MNETETQNRVWHLIDLDGQVLGRISTQIADILSGKDNPSYTPNLDRGGCVVAINAAKIKVTGNKAAEKRYYKHSGYIGNLKTREYSEVLANNPEEIIKHSVKGMLAKNKLNDLRMARFKVYAGNEHPHVNIKFVNR
jgi:large subunit ribosomal protein L13